MDQVDVENPEPAADDQDYFLDDNENGELWDEFRPEEIEERAASIVAKLLASSSVVQSTVTSVVGSVSHLTKF